MLLYRQVKRTDIEGGNRTMIKTNAEIAKMVEDRGYDFQTALESIDFGRTAEEEEMEIT